VAGKNGFFDARVIPSAADADPEVAWAGLTENEARAAGVSYGKGVFPCSRAASAALLASRAR
jgi:dihydrolipoamide dehydrogenase